MTLRSTVTARPFAGGLRARWFTLVIYDTPLQLRAAAAKYRDEDPALWTNAAGCVQPCFDDPGNGFAGVIRLCRDHCTVEVVAHEALHAAAALYRSQITRRINLGGQCRAREEDLAYIAGDVTSAIVHRLQVLGVWATPP